MSEVKTAPVDMFTTLRPRLLKGRLLHDIKAVQATILRTGKLTPLIVTRSNGRLVVIDGRKRLAALRRMDFLGLLPRSLASIPYIEIADVRRKNTKRPTLRLAA